jgi:hypothetical protein
MNATTILAAIIIIVLADFLLESVLSFLNCRRKDKWGQSSKILSLFFETHRGQ